MTGSRTRVTDSRQAPRRKIGDRSPPSGDISNCVRNFARACSGTSLATEDETFTGGIAVSAAAPYIMAIGAMSFSALSALVLIFTVRHFDAPIAEPSESVVDEAVAV
jgi:hypothetical protein